MKNFNDAFDKSQMPLMNSLIVELEREDKKHRENVIKEKSEEKNGYFMRELQNIKSENKELRNLILSQNVSANQLR